MSVTSLSHTSPEHSRIAPGEIAIGVIIGRASEFFDFFVYGIASVLVFPAVFFPFERGLEGTLYAFVIFAFAFIARPDRLDRLHGDTTPLRPRDQTDAGAVSARHLHRRHCLPAGLRHARQSLHRPACPCFRVGQGIALGGSWDGLPRCWH